ncbi:hypothetical protein BDY19DRAFT_910965, partial [Irpex rosettiformis]
MGPWCMFFLKGQVPLPLLVLLTPPLSPMWPPGLYYSGLGAPFGADSPRVYLEAVLDLWLKVHSEHMNCAGDRLLSGTNIIRDAHYVIRSGGLTLPISNRGADCRITSRESCSFSRLELRRVTAPSALASIIIAFVTLIDWLLLVFRNGIIQGLTCLRHYVSVVPFHPKY